MSDKVDAGRRGFLKGMAVAPIAIKVAADQAVLESAGMGGHMWTSPLGAELASGAGMSMGEAMGAASAAAKGMTGDKLKQFIAKKVALSYVERYVAGDETLPRWVAGLVQQESDDANVHSLSTDILALKSISPQHKYRMQYKENIKWRKKRLLAKLRTDVAWHGQDSKDFADTETGLVAAAIERAVW